MKGLHITQNILNYSDDHNLLHKEEKHVVLALKRMTYALSYYALSLEPNKTEFITFGKKKLDELSIPVS